MMQTDYLFVRGVFGKRLMMMSAVCLLLILSTGCSIRKMAVNQMANAIAGSGNTYASDDDPELIREAAPFSLKLIETLLAETPDHKGLLLAAARGFTQYDYAFIQEDADEMENKDLATSQALRARARRMFLRARNYAIRGLEVDYPGFEKALRENPKAAVKQVGKEDVPFLYWAAASWGSAISNSKDNPELIADQPIVEALIDRALELDEAYDSGAIHAFLISYESARKGVKGDAAKRAKQHFERAMELSKGKLVSPLVAYAETVCVSQQNRKEFEALLNQALAIDPDSMPDWRMGNLVMQRRARWLLGRADELFVE